MRQSASALLILPLCLIGAYNLVFAQDTFPECGFIGCYGEPECIGETILTPNASINGCCPGCVTYLKINATCKVDEGLKCTPGLECEAKKCKIPKKGICKSYPFRNLMWEPKCELDGSYSAVQCKGERLTGRCFCYSKEGVRIFGHQWWSKAENMTCACSRKVEDLKAQGRTDVTIHCTEEGNFEPLQCDSGVCWCADEKTGDALAEVVPMPMMEMLPCYNATLVGDQYLRICDSAQFAQNVLEEEMVVHGTAPSPIVINCGLDGSYAPVQFDLGRRFCAWKDFSPIGSFATETIPVGGMNCYCARDTRHFAEAGFSFTLQCGQSGNYNALQRLDGEEPLCVDKDGFAYAKPVYNSNAQEYSCPLGVLPEP